MVIEAEDAAGIEADSLEDAVAVKETMVEDRNGGLSFGNEFTVEIDFHGKRGAKYTFPNRRLDCPQGGGKTRRSGGGIRHSALEQVGDAGGPAGLVGGTEAAAGFGVEVFVEKERVAVAPAVAGTGAVGAGKKKGGEAFG